MENAQKDVNHKPVMYYNPETGEVLDDVIVNTTLTLTTEQIPKLARQIRAGMARLHLIEEFEKQEIGRIRESCQVKSEQIQRSVDFLIERTRQFAEQAGHKKLEYPGLGTFKTNTGREFVDDSGYQQMSEEERVLLQNRQQGFFRVKTTVTPDKAEIKKRLKEIEAGTSESTLSGFEMKRHPDSFVFVAE